MSGVTCLFAAGLGEPIVILILILISIVSYVLQWIGKMNQAGPAKPPQRPAAPQPPQQDKGVEDEIAEFLRRAAERRGQPAAPAAGASPAKPRPAMRPPAQPPVRWPPQQPVPAQVIEEQPVGAEVVQHVEKYLNTSEFGQRTSRLGSEVAQTDTQLGEHLHAIFDHQVSALASKPGESAAAPGVEDSPLPEDQQNVPPITAAALAEQLSSIEGIRQAVVINEILRRPEERWK